MSGSAFIWVVVYSSVDVTHQLIAKRQVDPVSVYCDKVGGVMSFACCIAFLCGSTLVKAGTLDFKSDDKHQQTKTYMHAQILTF